MLLSLHFYNKKGYIIKYFQLKFEDGFGEEGDSFKRIDYVHCDCCGLNHSPLKEKLNWPESSTAFFHASLYEPVNLPIIDIAGLLIAKNSFIRTMLNYGITGFEADQLKLTIFSDIDEDQADEIKGFSWLKITGKSNINNVWTKLESVCPACQKSKYKSFYQPYRKIFLQHPLPKTDFSRTHESQAGVIVSQRVVDLLQVNCANISNYITFKEIKFAEKPNY